MTKTLVQDHRYFTEYYDAPYTTVDPKWANMLEDVMVMRRVSGGQAVTAEAMALNTALVNLRALIAERVGK